MNIFAGLAGVTPSQAMIAFGSTETLGLPESYGAFCIIAGAVLVTLAAYLLPKSPSVEKDLDDPTPIAG